MARQLRGIKPDAIQKRLKALWFGPPNVGKTTAAIQFPKPYLIDTEKGAENEQYVKKLNAVGGLYYFTADCDELVDEVLTLLTTEHPYQTLIIDPLTVAYNDSIDKAVRRIAASEGLDEEAKEVTAFGRHKAGPDRKIKHLINLLLRLDMNVIITSHSKAKWEKVGGAVKEAGTTFDCFSKLEYIFDLVFEIEARGRDRLGIVRKTRVEAFPIGEIFPFTYDEIANRYGRDVLERKAMAQELATPEQVATLTRLIQELNIPQDVTDKWLDKAAADTFAELPTEIAGKCITYCIDRVTKGAA